MFEIIYILSVLLYFVVAKVLTTYGYSTKDSSYYRSDAKHKVPYTRLSAMPIPRLLGVIITGFIPVLNTFLAILGFIFAAIQGFGPTPADVREWFASRRAKKAQKPADESESL